MQAGLPAEKAGIEAGDIITKVQGKTVERFSDLPRLVGMVKPGDKVTLQVFHDGKYKDVTADVIDFGPETPPHAGRRPDARRDRVSTKATLGLKVTDLSDADRARLHVKGGVRVDSAEGAAARAGVQEGDIILSIGNVQVTSAKQFTATVAKLDKTKADRGARAPRRFGKLPRDPSEQVKSLIRRIGQLTCPASGPAIRAIASFRAARIFESPATPAIFAPPFASLSQVTQMAQYVFTMNRLGKIVPPKREILKGVSLSFFPGAKIGVLGLNGSGKSTLLKIMAGVDKDYEGEATPMPGLNIGYLPQEPQLNPEQTVRESVEEGMGGVLAAKKRLDEVYVEYGLEDADFDKLAAEQAELEAIISSAGSDNVEHQLEIAADALRLPAWEAVVGNLSGGEKRRVALCRLLLSKPDMLLLDEPTNHLDAESVDWLEQFLQRFSGTVVAITHDRYFLDNAAEWILELDRGRGIPHKGNYSEWLLQKETRLETEQKTEDARTKAMKKELEWVRSNPKGRQAKSKARMARFEELSDFDYQKRNETNEIFIPVADRLGHEVIEFTNVSKGFGDRQLIDNLSFKVPAGAIVGIIGPNGAGKSTLFRMIAGKEQPDSGEVAIGKTVKMAFVDQTRDDLEDAKTVWQDVSGGLDNLTVGKFVMPSRAPTSAASTSRATTSRSSWATCPAANAAACTWPRR